MPRREDLRVGGGDREVESVAPSGAASGGARRSGSTACSIAPPVLQSAPDESEPAQAQKIGGVPPTNLALALQREEDECSARDAQLAADEALARQLSGEGRLPPPPEVHSELYQAASCGDLEAVDRLLAERTAIVIAHRLHTLDRVDDVLVLEDGRVVEHGERAALAADPTSRFAQLRETGMAEVLS